MAHAQKPDFIFPRNGRVHSNRWGRQFSRLLAAKVCPSAWVMLDRPRSEVAWDYWLPTPYARFPFRASPCAIRFRTSSTCLHVLSDGMYFLSIEIKRGSSAWVPKLFIAKGHTRYCGLVLSAARGKIRINCIPYCTLYSILKFLLYIHNLHKWLRAA